MTLQDRRRPTLGRYGAINRQGRVIAPPDFFPTLPILNPSDPWDSEVLSTTNSEGWTHTIDHSRRFAMPTRWQIDQGDGFGGYDLMKRIDGGTQFGEAERLWENFGTVDVEQANPTFGGFTTAPDNGRNQRLALPSIPLHFKNWTDGETIVCESAVIPLDFDTFGWEYAENAKKGGTYGIPGVHWQARQYKRNTFNYAGVPNLHHLFYASYWPFEMPAHETIAVTTTTAGLYLVDRFNANCRGWFAAANEPSRTFDITGNGDAVAFDGVDLATWGLNLDQGVINTEGGGGVYPLASEPGGLIDGSGHAFVALDNRGAGGNQVIAMGTKLYPDAYNAERPNRLYAIQARFAPYAVGVDENDGQILYMQSSAIGSRKPGWIGYQLWYATCSDVDALNAKMRHASREFFDSPLPWGWIPPHVIAETEHAGDLASTRFR